MNRVMNRDLGVKLLLGALLLAVVGWLSTQTEWVDQTVDTPARGEALRNPDYAVQRLGRALGAQITTAPNLERLPPTGATLWLASVNWNLFEDREVQLQRWVEAGGHLVVPARLLDIQAIQAWSGIERIEPPDEVDEDTEGADDTASTEESEASNPAESAAAPRLGQPGCPAWQELPGRAQAWPDRTGLTICRGHWGELTVPPQAIWGLASRHGAWVVRVPLGRGTITVISGTLWNLDQLVFEADHALLATAVLGFKPGQDLWWVQEETREPLMALVWRLGWPVLLMAALVLGLMLWRSQPRFGPQVGTSALTRRSMTEQIRGTGDFLLRHGRDALLRAQIRALDEASRLHLREHARLTRTERARALAALTGQPEAALQRALDTSLKRTQGELLSDLQVLEHARRHLRALRRTGTAPTPSNPSSRDEP